MHAFIFMMFSIYFIIQSERSHAPHSTANRIYSVVHHTNNQPNREEKNRWRIGPPLPPSNLQALAQTFLKKKRVHCMLV
jgi:hypothetical protein